MGTDRETRRANTAETQFRLVLATELFDRIAVLQLRDGGRLALDDSVCRWIVSGRVRRPRRQIRRPRP